MKKIAAPLIFLSLGLVFVAIGSSVSSRQEGKMGVYSAVIGLVSETVRGKKYFVPTPLTFSKAFEHRCISSRHKRIFRLATH